MDASFTPKRALPETEPPQQRQLTLVPGAPPQQSACDGPSTRPVLSLVTGSIMDLRTVTGHPMPATARGALVTEVCNGPACPFKVRWLPTTEPLRIRPGAIVLSWAAAGPGTMDVTARLGTHRSHVLMAAWPSLAGDWTDVVRPTVYEVTGLHSALKLATVALEVLLD